MDKAKKTSLSLGENMRLIAQRRADREYKGNFSAYVQELIERDQTPSTETAISATILDDLAPLYIGAKTERLRRNLSAICSKYETDQPTILHRLLDLLAHPHTAHAPIDPEQMDLVDARKLELLEAKARGFDRLITATQPGDRRAAVEDSIPAHFHEARATLLATHYPEPAERVALAADPSAPYKSDPDTIKTKALHPEPAAHAVAEAAQTAPAARPPRKAAPTLRSPPAARSP